MHAITSFPIKINIVMEGVMVCQSTARPKIAIDEVGFGLPKQKICKSSPWLKVHQTRIKY